MPDVAPAPRGLPRRSRTRPLRQKGPASIAKRQLGQVAAVKRDDDAAQKTAEVDTAVPVVGRQAVGLALRVVEFLLPGLHVDVRIGQLAEIDLWARYR